MDSVAFLALALASIGFVALLIVHALFGPGHQYRIRPAAPCHPESDEFVRTLEALCDARAHRNTVVEVLTNGERFYDAQVEAIAAARRSINLEAYIFARGEVTRRVVRALAERARAGVAVNVVLDGIGCFATRKSYLGELTAAGGRVAWYHPLRWHTLPRLNNRTHRELLIIDGELGFVGGAGFADHWLTGGKGGRRWRDTVCRVRGEAVTGLQSAFIENWLETAGEILAGGDYFPFRADQSGAVALVVNSSPTVGHSTRARILFQTLLASAQKSVTIQTPYFLPDQSAREEMMQAVRRGVDVRVIVPGDHHDHPLARRSSRRLFGGLLRAGVRIYEYGPSMIHVKCLVVDGIWSVVGTTNFDNRSFGINDEVNLAVLDGAFAARLLEDVAEDLENSREVTYEVWRRRSLLERCHEQLGSLLERQQ